MGHHGWAPHDRHAGPVGGTSRHTWPASTGGGQEQGRYADPDTAHDGDRGTDEDRRHSGEADDRERSPDRASCTEHGGPAHDHDGRADRARIAKQDAPDLRTGPLDDRARIAQRVAHNDWAAHSRAQDHTEPGRGCQTQSVTVYISATECARAVAHPDEGRAPLDTQGGTALDAQGSTALDAQVGTTLDAQVGPALLVQAAVTPVFITQLHKAPPLAGPFLRP